MILRSGGRRRGGDLLTSPRLRGEVEIRGSRISGEGGLSAHSVFVEPAPLPSPLPAKSWAREQSADAVTILLLTLYLALLRHPHRPQCERIDDRDFVETVEAAGGAAMARGHAGARQHRAAAGHGGAQPRDPFGRLPIGHARI